MFLVPLLLLALAVASNAHALPLQTPASPHADQVIQVDADPAMSELGGTDWLLTAIRGEDVDPAIGSSLSFDEDGSVFGNGGCNRFRGGVEVDGNSLAFGNLASTMMACEEPKSEQETAFHAAMAETAAFRIEDGDLLLINGNDETVARLARAP